MDAKVVRDIMIPLEEYPHIPYWFTLRQAVAEMENSQLESDGRKSLPRGVLVFDERYRLLGLVRRRDILRGLEPEFLSPQESKPPFEQAVDVNPGKPTFDSIASGVRERAERPVSEVMQPVKASVQADDDLIKVVHQMTTNDLSFLPVLEGSKVVGVVRSVELFHEFAKLVL